MVFQLVPKKIKLSQIKSADETVSITLENGKVTVNGNLDVKGDVTYIHTSDLYVKDNKIVLNAGETGEGVSLGEAGISIDRGTLSDAQIIWDETNDKFVFRLESGSYVPITALTVETNNLKDAGQGHITLSSDLVPDTDATKSIGTSTNRLLNVYSVNVNASSVTTSSLSTDSLTVSTSATITGLTLGSDLNANNYNINNVNNISASSGTISSLTTDNLTVNTSATISSLSATNVSASSVATNELKDNGQGYITLSSHLIPVADNTIDLGSETKQWRYIYTRNLKVTDTASLSTDLNISGSIIPSADNTYDLGSSTLRWRNIYVNELYFGNVECLKKGIYAYKIKHNETTHPTELDDFLYRFLFKYLDNIQTSTIINNLSHSFNDDYYTGIFCALVYIANDGYYDIGVNSDDASAVFVDGTLAVAWLGGHGMSSHWYQTAFNSVCVGIEDVDGDGVSEPKFRTTLHPNGIYLSKGWHLIVAVFEEIYGGDKIEVYIRPHQDEDPSTAGGTNTGWALIGDDAVAKGYILDYRVVPLGLAIPSIVQLWKNAIIYNPERNTICLKTSISSNIIPSLDNTYNLGSSTNRWANLYAVNVNASTTKTNNLTDNGAGQITLSSHIIPAADNTYDLGAPDKMFRAIYTYKLTVAEQIQPSTDIIPTADATYNLGSATNRWKAVYTVDLYTGDIKLMNNWVITERDENGEIIKNGVRILNDKGEEIFRITEDGIYFKGKKIKLVFEE